MLLNLRYWLGLRSQQALELSCPVLKYCNTFHFNWINYLLKILWVSCSVVWNAIIRCLQDWCWNKVWVHTPHFWVKRTEEWSCCIMTSELLKGFYVPPSLGVGQKWTLIQFITEQSAKRTNLRYGQFSPVFRELRKWFCQAQAPAQAPALAPSPFNDIQDDIQDGI